MEFLKDLIIRLFRANTHKVYRINQICTELAIPRNKKSDVKKILKELSADNQIKELRNNHYTFFKKSDKIIGRIQIAEKGFGFVRPTNGTVSTEEIFIPPPFIKDAMDGDLVEVSIHKSAKTDGKSSEGKVDRVIERGRIFIVGRFLRTPYGASIEPRDKSFKRKIIITKKFKRNEIKDDTWVVVKITNFTPMPEPLIAQISEILGEDGDPGLDVMILMRDYGVRVEFPPKVIKETESFPDSIPIEESQSRLDLRNLKIFTIDPVHAKDFDDALSIEKLSNNLWKVGVHIADVAYYVNEGSELDNESLERGTSIYPVDRVVPMLPERLSNNLCSLNPNVDRLTMSVFAELNNNAEVKNVSFHNSIIRSVHRLNYYEVQKIFDNDFDTLKKYSNIIEDLMLLKDITQKLRDNRIKRGALDLDIPEIEVVMDKRGVAIDLRPYERLESHKLVEECMLLANEIVANHLIQLKIPTVFRIHEVADPFKLNALAPALKIFGLFLPSKEKITTKVLQSALAQTQKMENGSIARRMILRSLKRARYSSENRGHFGLASPAYLHFTSPIRRYPDLVVHRILKRWIKNPEFSEEQISDLKISLSDIAIKCSESEDNADLIERDTTTLKCIEFMRKFIGDVFEGFITAINAHSIYVELKEYPVEGVVYLKSITQDNFKLDKTGFRLIGKRTGKILRLGQNVSVQIIKISVINVEMELRLLDDYS